MNEPVWLLKPAFIAAHGMLIDRFGGLDGIRDEGLVDSALAATYAARIIRHHPFVDGNKQTGFITAYMFLDLNRFALRADELSATEMTQSLAASNVSEKGYANWLEKNLG